MLKYNDFCFISCRSDGLKSQGCSTVVISPACVKHDPNGQTTDPADTDCCDLLQQSSIFSVRNSQLVDLDQELELERLHSLIVEQCGKLGKLRS